MKQIEYTQLLTDEDKLRIEFTQDRGKILKFVVQYYSLINSRWRTIMRIDNCHGFPHRHVYHLRKMEFKVVLSKDANTAFTEGKEYILKNFQKIAQNFLFSK
jgi:hypothetical protein